MGFKTVTDLAVSVNRQIWPWRIMSISAMRKEAESQPTELAKVAGQLLGNKIRLPLARSVFTGSGDSWAAALFAREISKRTVDAEDPAELLATPEILKNKYVVIISAGGRTRANLELGEKARVRGNKTIAVTSDANSPLARICDASIIIDYKRAGVLTAGTISFTASLLACTKLLQIMPTNLKLQFPLLNAEKWARGVPLDSRGKCVFVGSGVDRAVAEYGACKVQEVLGISAYATYPEQVGHAVLFTLDVRRDTIVCVDSVGNEKTRGLYELLFRLGFRVLKIFSREKNRLTSILAESFGVQYLALPNAERKGQRECAFLRDRSRLELSNKLIY